MDVKIEQRTRFPSRLVHDKVVKRVMLYGERNQFGQFTDTIKAREKKDIFVSFQMPKVDLWNFPQNRSQWRCGGKGKADVRIRIDKHARPLGRPWLLEGINETHMGDYEILLDVHEVINTNASELWELLSTFLEEGSDIVAFFTLLRLCIHFDSGDLECHTKVEHGVCV